jgi:mannose-6-phosphate isomerase-like protein (cupin superfamily)
MYPLITGKRDWRNCAIISTMKLVRRDQARTFKNSRSCTAIEYPIDDKDINGAVIKLNGRYPDKGYVVNTVCKEMVYILKGTGQLSTPNENQSLQEGDMVLIAPGERYYFEGDLEMFMPCSPAWYPEQHKELAS